MLPELRASLIPVRVCPNLGKLILWLSTLQNCTNEELLNKQVQHFPNLYLTKIAGLQVESISNLRTSTVGRTHISQKNRKGFLHQTRLVGRHTREFNLYSLFFVRNMVGVLFLHKLHNVPSTKNNPEISYRVSIW